MRGILSLDQATTVGWAYSDPGEAEIQFGHQRMGREGASDAEVGAAFAIFLDVRIDVFQPAHIVFEQPYVGGGKVPVNPQTIFRLAGMKWQIELTCYQRGIDCAQATTSTFIKFFTGKGKYPDRAAKKRATVLACRDRGWRCSEDEADAVALLCFAEAKLFPQAAMKRAPGPLFAEKTLDARAGGGSI